MDSIDETPKKKRRPRMKNRPPVVRDGVELKTPLPELEAKKKYAQTPKGKSAKQKAAKKYAQSEHGRAKMAEIQSRYRDRNREDYNRRKREQQRLLRAKKKAQAELVIAELAQES